MMTEKTIPDSLDSYIEEFSSKKRGNPKWQKGQSGNPKGRPKGLRDRRTMVTDALMADAHAIVKVVIEKALGGDVAAASLILSRCTPSLRPQAQTVQFDLNLQGTATEQASQILEAISNGDISPDTGNQLIDSVSKISA